MSKLSFGLGSGKSIFFAAGRESHERVTPEKPHVTFEKGLYAFVIKTCDDPHTNRSSPRQFKNTIGKGDFILPEDDLSWRGRVSVFVRGALQVLITKVRRPFSRATRESIMMKVAS